MSHRCLPVLLVSVPLLLALAPAHGQTTEPYNDRPSAVRVRFGEFEPEGDSIYWDQREIDFTGSVDDFADSIYAVDFVHMLTERWGVMASVSYYEGQDRQAFRDFVDDRGADILHDTSLEVATLNVGMVFHLLRRDAAVSPYIGGGFGFYGYDLEESGDFIDFDTFEVFPGTFTADGDAFGAYLLVGLEVPLTAQVSIFGEARWHDADDELEGDFREFGTIDLGGQEYSAGLSFRF